MPWEGVPAASWGLWAPRSPMGAGRAMEAGSLLLLLALRKQKRAQAECPCANLASGRVMNREKD